MIRVLILAASGAHFAVPVTSVFQVLRHPLVTRIPLSPLGLIGIVNVRGEIVPLLDTAILTGTGTLNEPPFAVLVSDGDDIVALGAEELPIASDLEEPVGAGSQPGEVAVYSNGGRLVVLIDVEELMKNRLDLKRAS